MGNTRFFTVIFIFCLPDSINYMRFKSFFCFFFVFFSLLAITVFTLGTKAKYYISHFYFSNNIGWWYFSMIIYPKASPAAVCVPLRELEVTPGKTSNFFS